MKKIILMLLIVTPMAFGLFALQANAGGDTEMVSLYCKPDRHGNVDVADVVSSADVSINKGDSCAAALVGLLVTGWELVSTTHTSSKRVVYTLVNDI